MLAPTPFPEKQFWPARHGSAGRYTGCGGGGKASIKSDELRLPTAEVGSRGAVEQCVSLPEEESEVSVDGERLCSQW